MAPRTAICSLLVALVLASCAEPTPAVESLACRSELSISHPAVTGFWETFRADDRAARAAAIDALRAARDEHPDETELVLLLALAQLWALADPDVGITPAEQGALAANVLDDLRAARRSCPGDYRIHAWLGPTLVRMGRVLGSDRYVDEGMAVLEEGAARYPEFVLFSLAMVLAEEPVDSPEFARGIQALRDNAGVCADAADDFACVNGPRAAHNMEGAAVFMGDLFARAGDVEAARAAYESALGTADYATWDHQDLLADRIATVEMRAMLSQDADPANDPVMVTNSAYACSVCHAE